MTRSSVAGSTRRPLSLTPDLFAACPLSCPLQFAFKYLLLGQKWTYDKKLGGMIEAAISTRKKELAIWLREGLVRLGPTFIKIGQQFSTRVDVLAPEFIKELEKLQVCGGGAVGKLPGSREAFARGLGMPPFKPFKLFGSCMLAGQCAPV